jgi:pyruvate kinase
MSQVAEFTENHINYRERFFKQEFKIRNNLDAISHATCQMAIDVGAKAIVVHSRSGVTARMVSRFRCPIDIIGMTTSERIWRRLNLSWGVIPILNEEFTSTDVMYYHGFNVAKDILKLESGDNVVMTGGLINGKAGNTNTIKVETVS